MLSSLVNFAKEIAPVVPFANMALSWLGGESRNSAQAAESQRNRDFQADMSNTSYQRAMADMKAAGLNPMLAFSQGGASLPTGNMANFENSGLQASTAYAASRSAEASHVGAEASAKQADVQDKLVDASVRKIAAEINKINLESANLPTQGRVLLQTIEMLADQAALFAQKGETEVSIRSHLKAIVSKLAVETDLSKLDLDAAVKFENMGRELKELYPFFQILRSVLRPR